MDQIKIDTDKPKGDSLRDFREKLILKEMEISHSSIKNLDDIIHKNKNFAFLAWGGSLYLLAKDLASDKFIIHWWMYMLTAAIPLLFWIIDFRWRKHLPQIYYGR